MTTPDAHVTASTISETEAETQLLLSTDECGHIPFPEGNSRAVAVFLHALSVLDERGHIQHRQQNGDLVCYLSDSGKRLKAKAELLH